MKNMNDQIDRNINVVYLKKDLSFEKLIPKIRSYIIEKYDCSMKKRMNLVANVKNIFDKVYKNGGTIYSGVHGEKETEILTKVLGMYVIKTAQVNPEEAGALIVISEDDVKRIVNKQGDEYFIKKMFDDIEIFLKERCDKG